eukprot:TRINITY_DN52245_c0_g1_i1.p3 TRINITY_DN52245_c0_g1~~TRINITY_DN52245_c0_g1_i1.p3  ORF type:complete len:116 (-),score=11.65 TRINITY_DN52245_c0_g1_i1:85-432(-)
MGCCQIVLCYMSVFLFVEERGVRSGGGVRGVGKVQKKRGGGGLVNRPKNGGKKLKKIKKKGNPKGEKEAKKKTQTQIELPEKGANARVKGTKNAEEVANSANKSNKNNDRDNNNS